jgi:hypothetical protein
MVVQFFKGQAFVWHSPWEASQGGLIWALLGLSAPLRAAGSALEGKGGGFSVSAWQSAAASGSSGEVIMSLVLLGGCITAALQVFKVGRAVWLRGRGWGGLGSALLEVALFFVLIMGLGAWVFSATTKALADEHWVQVYACGGCLFVELAIRHMLAHVCGDDGILQQGALAIRILLFSALPYLLSLGALGGLQEPALLLALAASLLSVGYTALTACTQCASALGIQVFSIQLQLAAGKAAGAARGAASGAKGGAGAVVAAASPKGSAPRKRGASASRR